MRLKRTNGRGQTEAHKHHFARTARRVTGNGAVAGNGTYLAFDLMELNEVVRCSREKARGALHKAMRSTKRHTTNALLGIYDAKLAARSAGPEGWYGSLRTLKEGEEAQTTAKSPPHRPAQPFFHHTRQTWTAIASCDNLPLLRRLSIWTKINGIDFPYC